MTHQLLFIDDIEAEAEIACWELGKAGIACEYRVVDSEAALRAAVAERTPGMILCDAVMPSFDNWDALRVCRQIAPGVPFVLYSGTVSVEDTRLCAQRGVFGTAEKDVTSQLIGVVRRGLGLL